MELPFKLYKNHKSRTKSSWKVKGLIHDDIYGLYQKYIYATNCDLCNKEFKSSQDRQMEHNHETGEFRNIVCTSCNMLKYDVKIQCNNKSGYRGICKNIDKSCKQGFNWVFSAHINGKQKRIKSSVDFDKLVEFANKWKLDNKYNT